MGDYAEKKAFFEKILTLYGRKPVLEALEDPTIMIHKLHLSTSNKPAPILQRIKSLAERRGIAIAYHDKLALSRISKNARQDQGVALDIVMPHFYDTAWLLKQQNYRVLALDNVTNPQNVGMIVRSAAAGRIDALIIPKKGTAKLDALVVKASAGTLFKMPIVRCDNLAQTLDSLRDKGATLFGLDAEATESFQDIVYPAKSIFVLGNESEGLSKEVALRCDRHIAIPMQRGVESLNVAVTAALLAFCS